MNSHKSAPLTSKGREAMVRSVTKGGLSQAAAARQFNITLHEPRQSERRHKLRCRLLLG
jgi:hypothetical protein